jgi:hypothetical protein
MLVPQELLSSVVFLGETTATGDFLAGTGYFVGVPCLRFPERRFVYLVTAGHCVEGRTNIIARVNATPEIGGTATVQLPDGAHWLRHPGPAADEDRVDLAAIRWPFADEIYAAG